MKFFLIIILSFLSLIYSKIDEISIFKALVCVNIITSKHQNVEEEASTLSPIILTCFIKISDEQVRRLTEGIERNEDIPLSEEEITSLMDVESIKDLPEEEVKQKGEQLEEAIREFQKMQESYGETGDDDGYDEGYDDGDDGYDYEFGGQKNNMTKKGFFGLIKKGIFNFGEILLNSWYIICILVVLYLLLLEIRRNNNPDENKNEEEKEEKEDNNENKDDKKENEKEDKKENEKEKDDKKDDENKEKDEKGEIKEKEKGENKEKDENKKEDNNLKEKID